MKTRISAGALTRVLTAVIAIVIAVVLIGPGRTSQNSCVMPNTGTVSGLTLVNDINACNGSLLSLYSGASAPSGPTTGMFWYNTTTNWIQQYDGTSWMNTWFVDATNHQINLKIGGGITSQTIASATTTDLGSIAQSFKTITGTTTISSFGSSADVGSVHIVKFSGALTLTYNATSMILPSAASITTTAGDIAFALYLGAGNWQVLHYAPASGTALVNPSVEVGTMHFFVGPVAPTKYVFGFGQAITRASFPTYLAAVTLAQSVTATSGNATLTSVPSTQGMGAGMPIEGSCIAASTTISSVTGSTIVLSANATANGACTVTVFFTGYGSGGSTSTVGVPDCRGRVIAGRDDMGGTASTRITSTFFGIAGGGSTALNGNGGNESIALTASLIPNLTSTNASQSIVVTGPSGHTIVGDQTASSNNAPGGANAYFTGGVALSSWSFSGNNSISVTSTGTGGTSPAHRTVQPTLVQNCIIRVLTMNLPANDNVPINVGRETSAIMRKFT